MEKGFFKKIIHIANLALFLLIIFFMFCGTSSKITLLGRNFTISFWLSLVSLPLFIFSYFFVYKTKELNIVFVILIVLFAALLFTSIISSIVLTPSYNHFGSEIPALVVLEESVKYLFDIFLFLYLLFFVKYITQKQIDIILYTFMGLWVLTATIQFIVYLKPQSSIANIYDTIDLFGILVDSSTIDKARYEGFRLYSFLSEPSVNCIFLCGFVLPFLIYKILNSNGKVLAIMIHVILLLLFLVGALLTKSSAVYTTLFAFFVAIVFAVFKNCCFSRKIKTIFAVSIFFVITLFFIIPKSRELIVYYMVEKIFSLNNLSTAYRYSTVYNDFLIFLKMPLFGCGDGLQGLFYFENISGTQLTISYETNNSLTFKQGLLNGGALIPSIVSGFGIFGVALIGFVLSKHFHYVKDRLFEVNEKNFWHVYSATLFSVFVALTVAIGLHRNFSLLFFLVLPFYKIGKYEINLSIKRIIWKTHSYHTINI